MRDGARGSQASLTARFALDPVRAFRHNRRIMLHVNDLTYRIGPRTLLDQATVALPDGARAGLVGRNGTGKTTLFKLILGETVPDNGSVSVRKGARLGHVAQEAPGGGHSLLDFVLAADTERAELLQRAETETDAHEIAHIQTRLADIDAHSAPARAARILAGLGFDHAAQQQSCSAFSGGWRMRIALAAVLFSEPDLLLLDEPTNYLDLEGVMWLETYLARYPHTVLVISHDRDLLNTAVDTIIHLENGKLSAYRGGYDRFERQRLERQALNLKLKKKQEDERRRIQGFIDRFRAKATKARQAQSRIKLLEKMQPISAMVDAAVVPFDIPNPAKALSPPIVAMEEASVGYAPGAPVLSALNLRIDQDDRIGLLGSNGNGKSTFAKLLTGRLVSDSGRIKRSHKMEVAYFAQHQLDELRPAESPYDHVRSLMPDATEAQIRARTAQLGFGPDKADTATEKLSGGEKARLLIGLATFHGPHLLILDEPTNHLDADSRDALIQALNVFEGAVILISHDRRLIEATTDRLWLVSNGTVAPFEGDMEEYRRFLLDSRKGDRSDKPKEAPKEPSLSKEEKRKLLAKRRAELAPLKKEIDTLDKTIIATEKRIAAIDNALADPDLFTKDPEKGAVLSKERADMVASLNKAEEKWLAKSEEYEALKSADDIAA